eukprot:snap_masked-scaffold_7-processed-gene-7.6-mRNA-1 protein AED:1.00 eAED:1.00 QI:0/0/0/0/1/1/2/0/473
MDYFVSVFLWNLEWSRFTAMTSEFAFYYNTTNNFSPTEGELGMDFLIIVSRVVNLFFYPVAGFLVDRYGLRMITIGALGQSIGSWVFYIAFSDFALVVFAKFIISLFGPLVYTSILRISTHWFGKRERVFATSLALFGSALGSSLALWLPTFYQSGTLYVESKLKSCKHDITFFEELLAEDDSLACNSSFDDAFCCIHSNTNVEGVNLLIAVLFSFQVIFSHIFMQDSPKILPAVDVEVQKSLGIAKSIHHIFGHSNFVLLTLADSLASGVVLLVYNTLSRSFPGDVLGLAIKTSSFVFPLALPISYVFSRKMGKSGRYYDYAAVCYYIGFLLWFLATLGLSGGKFGHIVMVVCTNGATILYALWQVAVFELKLEYVYSKDFALQGIIVGIDRALISLSSFIFLAAFPPENYKGNLVSGRMFTFLCGLIIFFIAILLVAFLPHKRLYKRRKIVEAQTKEGFTRLALEENALET